MLTGVSFDANDWLAVGAPDHVRHVRRLSAIVGRAGLPDSRDPVFRIDALRRRGGEVEEEVQDRLEVERDRKKKDLPLCAARNIWRNCRGSIYLHNLKGF